MLSSLMRRGFRRGIVGGSRTWTYVAVFAGGLRLLQRVTRGKPEVVFSGEVREGETLVVSTLPRSSIMER